MSERLTFCHDSAAYHTQCLDKASVWFVGAGLGHVDLLTVQAAKLLSVADVLLFSSGYISDSILQLANGEACLVDTLSLDAKAIHVVMYEEAMKKKLIVRLTSGDPAIFSATPEEKERLEQKNVRCAVIPGISAAFAAAAVAGVGFSVPEKVYGATLLRYAGRSGPLAEEDFFALCRKDVALALYLPDKDTGLFIVRLKQAGFAPSTPVVIAGNIGLADETVTRTTMEGLEQALNGTNIHWKSVILILPNQ